MELGSNIIAQTQPNRKRKRKPSGPKRRPAMVMDEVVVEPIDFSPQKMMKTENLELSNDMSNASNAGTSSTDDESKIENARIPSFPDAAASPPQLSGTFSPILKFSTNEKQRFCTTGLK